MALRGGRRYGIYPDVMPDDEAPTPPEAAPASPPEQAPPESLELPPDAAVQRNMLHDMLLLGAAEALHQVGPIVKDQVADLLTKPEPEPEPPHVILPPGVDVDADE